jgi:starch-binding outer membrane protein, SusD/RagB family
MKNYNRFITVLSLFLILSSCSDDLNLMPTNDITADIAYATPEGYKNALAKVYGCYANSGSFGNGSSDISGIAPGPGDFLRGFWSAQELTTDEAACKWLSDDGIPGLDYMTWTASNAMLEGIYARSILQITYINEFLRESTDAKLADRGISGTDAIEIAYYAAEARFLRAFQYWVLMDLFGNPPFTTEKDVILGKIPPQQIVRKELFKYVESELLAIEGKLKESNEYGRVTKTADWALLARLYLNAHVYADSSRYSEAATYAYKVISSGKYSLHPVYPNLFMADNNLNNPEVILSIDYDGWHTQNWGGLTYIINAAVSSEMNPTKFGVPNGAWAGIRSRENLPYLFGDYSNTRDSRAMFFGNNPVITDITDFTQGLAVTKFKNVLSTGEVAPSPNGQYCSTDFPLFRLAEMYLIYAEAILRGAEVVGSALTPEDCINKLRFRAYGDHSGDVASVNINDILDERGRELYWEGFRRTDLIRFNKFTSSEYLWSYKGGVETGMGVDSYRNLFPLSATDVISNPNLKQNPGY